jgi:hypothetical protein
MSKQKSPRHSAARFYTLKLPYPATLIHQRYSTSPP